jgi:hypothetical protein
MKLTDEQRQQAEEQRVKTFRDGQAAIAKVKSLCPDWESKLMVFRRKDTGEIFAAGHQIGFARLQDGTAELVNP